MAVKKNFQEEFSGFMGHLKVRMEKLSKEAAVLAGKGGKEIQKAAAIGRIEIDIMGLNIEKEKNYYLVGKKLAQSGSDKESWNEIVQPFLATVNKIDGAIQKKKNEISKIKAKKAS
ncbi:MAG: hypothetical protein PHS37_03915 [Candidatus Omnitrophica bacterium]|nr:hypothetical protein [Candidatus Omnitrophota bacterium]